MLRDIIRSQNALIRDKPISTGSPWQNAYAERLIGSIRRECVDHVKAKRKKTSPTKATTRRKTTKVRKNLAKKAPSRRASQKKARPSANAAIKPTPVSSPAQPVAATPTATLTAQPAAQTTDFSQRVESLEVNHAPVTEVGPNDDFGLKVVEHAREHDVVYKVRP